MRLFEELLWNLTEVVDEADSSVFLEWIGYAIDVDVALVKEMMKHVDRLKSRLALLFEAKDEVDPLMQMGGNEVALQSLAMSSNKFPRITFGPRRKQHVVQRHAALLHAQVET